MNNKQSFQHRNQSPSPILFGKGTYMTVTISRAFYGTSYFSCFGKKFYDELEEAFLLQFYQKDAVPQETTASVDLWGGEGED